MTHSEFRKQVKTLMPTAKVKIREVSFSDLARGSAVFATVSGVKWTPEHWEALSRAAKDAGLILSTPGI